MKKQIYILIFHVLFSGCVNEKTTDYINENTILNPINSYGISKKITENYLKKKDNFVIFRFFNVIGTLTNNFDYNNSFSQKIFYKHKKKITNSKKKTIKY